MTKKMIQNVLMAFCASLFLSACAHYGHHSDCACGKDKKACEHHQDGKGDKKADEECKDCKK
jgi:hypothetical protein